MIFLGEYKAGASIFYAANFHNDTGTLEDPTSPEAQIRNSAGTWSALTAPAKQNTKTGHYGGTVDTTGFSVGQHIIRMAGTVATAKTVATEFCFNIVANIESDTYSRLGAPSGASLSADILAVKTDTGNIGVAGAGLTGLGDSRLTNLDATVTSRLPSAGYTAPDNAGIAAIQVKTDTIVWDDITNIKDESLGKWSINKITNVLTMYKIDGVTVLKQFNLTDNASVSERVPV